MYDGTIAVYATFCIYNQSIIESEEFEGVIYYQK